MLLAAGTGTRLRPLTNTVPKCLVPVNGRPLLDYWFENLIGSGIERILVNTHWLSPLVDAHLKGSAWRERIDSVHEPELLGTAGTILANRGFFVNERFLVAHADNLTDFDVASFIRAHERRSSNCVITMLAFRTDDPRSCGILELDADRIVRAFHEKVEEPPGDLANAAVYIMEPEVVAFIAHLGRRIVDLSTEVLPAFIGRIYAVETSGYHRDIGNLRSLALAEAEFPARVRRTS